MKATPDPTLFESAPAFNDWIDDQFVKEAGGPLQILGKQMRPSEVLHKFSFDTYQAAFPDFKRFREELIISTVTEKFPIIIAHPFFRFLEGSENELQRLQFLRDTWEGLINFVHALVVSEARAARLSLGVPAKCGQILSESLAVRIGTVESILGLAASSGLKLESSKLVDLGLATTIKELNQARNAFSHTGAVAEDQAKTYINECIEDVFDVLDGFRGLSEVRLLRYDRLDGLRIRHERFDGHAKTKRFGELPVSQANLGAIVPLLKKEETLLAVGGVIFNAHPFLHLIPQPGGHVTQVAFFKKTKGDAPNRKLLFEIVGEANEFEEDRVPFQPAINEIRVQFGEQPE